MWRSYDMVDGSRLEVGDEPALLQENALEKERGLYVEPRLQSLFDVPRSESIVRLPPGFLSF